MNKSILAFVMALAATVTFAQSKPSGENEFAKLPWVTAPSDGVIADRATIKLGSNLLFLGEQGTSKFLEIQGNPPRPRHYALVPNQGDWFAVFHFVDEGYVKDDEKIDANALMQTMKDNEGPANEKRRELGMRALHMDGWHVTPRYDATTNRLEWAVRLKNDEGKPIINYTSRLLGRRGYMSVVLVSEPQTLDADRAEFNAALNGFAYKPGERYAEFSAGDKVAAYGLGALVVGGAAAAAAKSGAGKAFFKAIGVGVLALGAGVWAFLKRILGRRKDSTPG